MPTVVHFDLPADDTARARKFYSSLFPDWKYEKYPGEIDFNLIHTTDLEGKPGVGGGIGRRMNPDQRISIYFGVKDLNATLAKVQKIGGNILVPRMAVPRFGDMAVCMDTENNTFGIWQDDPGAE
jgi:predicted enzyme related to lactoylglutathione lyase